MPETIQPHILVVDDDPQIRNLLQEYLTENALRVTVSSTGQQMAAILDDEAIDLVILDLRLAGEDGMAIARTLRDKSAIPIVMLTGVRDEADRVMGCSACAAARRGGASPTMRSRRMCGGPLNALFSSVP
jgi:two-component system, OmpR family, response regulator